MPITIFLSGLLGLATGPVLHHLAVRAGVYAPFGMLIPACEACGTPRRFPDWYRRRCRSCAETGRSRPLLLSLAGGALFAAGAAVAGSVWLVPGYLLLAALTLTLVVTDLDHKLIPNRVLYPGGLLTIAAFALGAVAAGRGRDLLAAVAGGAGYFGILLAVALVARGGFGFGDVKLGALLGFVTAFESLRIFLLGIFFTGVLGGLPAIVLLVLRRAGRGDELPYGPAMVAGTWAALLVGEPFLRWYSG